MEEVNSVVSTWLEEIAESRKREKDYRKNGVEILDIYNGKNPDKVPFNILFSNTETLVPAVFSNTPRPIVKKRFFSEESPLVDAGSKAATRMLEYLLDTNVDGYQKFEKSMKNVVMDALLPGRGISQIKYDAKITGEGEQESVEWEAVCMASRKWNMIHYGYATVWEDVPWMAYEDFIDETEAKSLFDEEIVAKIEFTEGQEADDDDDKSTPDELKHIGKQKTARIYQIWDKSDRKIKYISPNYKEGYLKEQDDEFGITGFFNCPEPLRFIEKSNDLLPTAFYTIYENQANELNDVQRRINKVVKAIKVRGLYNGSLGDDIDALMDEDDNELLPTDESATLMEGGLEKNIWFMPLTELVGVLQQLIMARESCKQVIYEITGISDIVRGQSKASETLGAQKIKASWGSMRVKDKQKAVQQYARDALRIMLDIGVNKFSQKTWMKVTGLPYPVQEKRDQARQQLQIMKQQHDMKIQEMMPAMEQMKQQGQQVPPPPQFKPDPKLVEIAKQPAWEEILEFLKDDYVRSFKVDIETNSTLEAEATEDKEMVAEFMNAMAQFLNGIGPMIEKGMMSMDVAKSMLLEIAKRFRFGDDVEEHIKAIEKPRPQKDPKQEEQIKKFQEAQKKFKSDQEAFAKQSEQEKQKMQQTLKQEKDKFQQDKLRADEEIQKQVTQLESDRMQFKYDIKAAHNELRMEKRINDIQISGDQKVAQEKTKSLLKDSERKVQSMLDKHLNMVKEVSEQA